MREVSLETLPNVNLRDLSHDKNCNWVDEPKCFQIYFIATRSFNIIYVIFDKARPTCFFRDIKRFFDWLFIIHLFLLLLKNKLSLLFSSMKKNFRLKIIT